MSHGDMETGTSLIRPHVYEEESNRKRAPKHPYTLNGVRDILGVVVDLTSMYVKAFINGLQVVAIVDPLSMVPLYPNNAGLKCLNANFNSPELNLSL